MWHDDHMQQIKEFIVHCKEMFLRHRGFYILIFFSILIIIGVFSILIFKKCTSETDVVLMQKDIVADVVVVGAGPSGIAAAIELGRKGKNIVLVEETDWLGGQMTAAGVPNMDEGYLLKKDAGIYGEFIEAIKKAYGNKPINTCYWGELSRCFEPSVGRKVLDEMIGSDRHIQTLFHSSVISVQKDEKGSITSIVVEGVGKKTTLTNIHTTIVIDASETGYVLPLAGASYRIGNSIGSTTSTKDVCIQSITHTVVVRNYFNGVPKSLLFTPGNPPGGKESYESAAKLFMRSVTSTGNTWFVDGRTKTPYSWQFSTGYRGIPDSNPKADYYSTHEINKSATSTKSRYTEEISKTIINSTNDFSANAFYLENKSFYRKVTCQAKLRSLQYVYYIQVDLGASDWSIANDEGYRESYRANESCPELKGFEAFEKNLPVLTYIRESRRLIGDYTITGSDIFPEIKNPIYAKHVTSSLAVGDYSPDFHACATSTDLEVGLDTMADLSSDRRRMYEVPFESFVTKEVGGLIVAEKNLSSSRVASAALREQPIAMQTGLAAGAIAYVALEQKQLPSMVDYRLVQETILRANGRIFAR